MNRNLLNNSKNFNTGYGFSEIKCASTLAHTMEVQFLNIKKIENNFFRPTLPFNILGLVRFWKVS